MSLSHLCACVSCAPNTYPPEALSPERTSELHVGMRFLSLREAIYTEVYIDGIQHMRVVEAMAGRDGWALVYPEGPHDCRRCHSGPCLDVVRGHVTLRLIPEEERG